MLKTRLALLFLFFFILFSINVKASENYTYTYDINDVFVRQDHPTTNYNDASNKQALIIQSFTGQNIRTYMMWNVYPLISNVTIIDSAYLYLYEYAGTGATNRYFLVYNTSLNWTENNITWNTIPITSVLQSNQSYTFSNGQWTKINVTNALQSAINQNQNMSIMIRDNNETQIAGYVYETLVSKDSSDSHKPILEVTSHVSNCNSDCGDCGCKYGTTECYTPSIIGSYCNIEAGQPNVIKTVFNVSCTGTTYFECSTGTTCTQITPSYNFSGSDIWSSQNNTNWCAGCWFVNIWNIFKGGWSVVATNCYRSGTSDIKYECECNGLYCADMYTTNDNSTFVSIIPEWTAGCWNNEQSKYYNIINSTGQNTTVSDLIKIYVNNTTQVNNSKYMCDKLNTSTTCYDMDCNIISCSSLVGATCESNAGGYLALSIGGLMGITDCGLSQNILSIIISMIIGFTVLYYTRGSNQAGMSFIVGTLAPLTMFSLVSWFPAWLIVILIVISAYLLAKSLGIGGG